MDPRVYVYVAGPLREGDLAHNFRAAISAASQITLMGAYPYIPHLGHFWDLYSLETGQFWTRQRLAWLEHCDILYLLPGHSRDAEQDVQWAVKFHIPIIQNNYGALQGMIEQIKERKAEVGP